MNVINITLNISSLLFFIFLLIVYFAKANMPNLENKIYRYILFCNFFILVFDTLFWLLAFYLGNKVYIPMAVERLYTISVLGALLFITYYVIAVTFDRGVLVSLLFKGNRISTFGILLVLITAVIELLLPLKFEYSSDGIINYAYGPATVFLSMLLIVLVLGFLFVVLITKRSINKKKIFPIIIFIVLEMLTAILYFYAPSICIFPMLATLTSYLMYHTIENPDLKLITELELAKSQALKANSAKSELLSSMSHEIRTPLNVIVGLSEIIRSSEDIEEIHEDAGDIIQSSHNLLEIVNGILDISKIEANKIEMVETNYKTSELLDNIVKSVKVRIGEKPVEFRVNFADDIPENLYGDKGKIQQIIVNLLTNAIKYTERGYIDFDIKCINDEENCKLQITVSDTGRGIKESQIDKLFTKFNRLEEDRNTTIEGTGLGLAITKSFVEMMGGKIVVHSTYGEGSKFTVFLSQKIVKHSFNYHENNGINAINDFSGKKVLLVDDNRLNLKVASKLLKEFNIVSDLADSGFTCIDKVESNLGAYDIIFMDIMMPKMDGVETLKKLKEIEGFNIPVVALTADAMEGMHDKYISEGFNDYLSKPIDKDFLKDLLSKFLVSSNDVNNNSVVEEDIEEVIPKGNVEYLKENNIDVESALELLGDIEMYNETLNTFIEENKTRIPRIEKNKQEGNMGDYSIDVHALKSDSKYLGFKRLADISYEHELKSKDNDINYINEHYDELIEEYNKVNNIISNYI